MVKLGSKEEIKLTKGINKKALFDYNGLIIVTNNYTNFNPN